ncbi:hypothetical protein DSL72_008146 [Monilinia vaccinii-corymbosi]|uniref:SMP-30/Gluconolactonase/LRE-like region domain-containing protein n=1 Tax=Monilinia vaccinii-corymbosi TaxID=61207 RepID=A0A8A3PIV1_9HELO|nr:hypothetical protein DSL72_008146 [Monilinia vaccinii-corymbosi]
MAEHLDGTPSLVPYDIVARFPIGSFLENIAIFYIDPRDKNPQSTVQVIHDFNPTSEVSQEEDEEGGAYGSKCQAEAIIEHPDIGDIFYTFSGLHGKAGTWAVYRLDLREFDSVGGSATMKVEKLVDIPEAIWLNGATMIPQTSTLLMAESLQSTLFAFNIQTGKISTWLEDEELGKITTRPPWPGINGLQYFRGQVFGTVSDRGTLVRMQINDDGGYKKGSLEVVAKQLTGDDMAFDCEGNAYVATNPAHTVLKFVGLGMKIKPQKEERIGILGGLDQKETEGPTALAFGRAEDDRDCIYVTTNGGLVNPIGDDGPGEAVIAKVCVGVRGEA